MGELVVMKSLGIEKIPTQGLPDSNNGGSVVAIAGEDFCVIASDTRLSGHGYAILSREQPKLFKLSETTVLGSTGCWCDILTFCKVAQMTATMLYGKRFFPYYISNILAGLDKDGKGVVYSYDPVGHSERCGYRAGGSAVSLLQP